MTKKIKEKKMYKIKYIVFGLIHFLVFSSLRYIYRKKKQHFMTNVTNIPPSHHPVFNKNPHVDNMDAQRFTAVFACHHYYYHHFQLVDGSVG